MRVDRRAVHRGKSNIESKSMVVLILQQLGDVLLALDSTSPMETHIRIFAADLGLEIVPELRLNMFDGIHADVGYFALGNPIFNVVNEKSSTSGLS